MQLTRAGRSVKKNLALVQKLIEHDRMLRKKKTQVYHGYVNCGSGELLFTRKKGLKKPLDDKTWKKVDLRMKLKAKAEDSICEFVHVPAKAMEEGAYKVMMETLNVFNTALREAKIKNIKHSKAAIPQLRLTRKSAHLLHDSWRPINRLQAEALLQEYRLGAFLFRKDEFTAILEKNLGYPCYTLSFLHADNKVVEKTIVNKKGRYLFYNDDPNLEGKTYPSLVALLQTMKKQLSVPLLNKKS